MIAPAEKSYRSLELSQMPTGALLVDCFNTVIG